MQTIRHFWNFDGPEPVESDRVVITDLSTGEVDTFPKEKAVTVGKYAEDAIITRFESLYLVERVYQLSDEEMQSKELYHRNRVTLRKLAGVNGLPREDFAINLEVA